MGTIEKREMNWLLYLVNEITGDEDTRNVRVLEVDVRGRIRIDLRPHHSLDQRRQACRRMPIKSWLSALFCHFTREVHLSLQLSCRIQSRGSAPRARRRWLSRRRVFRPPPPASPLSSARA